MTNLLILNIINKVLKNFIREEFLQLIFNSHHSTPIQFLSQKTIFIKVQA